MIGYLVYNTNSKVEFKVIDNFQPTATASPSSPLVALNPRITAFCNLLQPIWYYIQLSKKQIMQRAAEKFGVLCAANL